jgi:hypothetical protein
MEKIANKGVEKISKFNEINLYISEVSDVKLPQTPLSQKYIHAFRASREKLR